MVSLRLNAELRSGGERVVVTAVAPFDWDEVCVLGSYRELPYDIPLDQYPHWSMSDSTAGLGFLKGRRLVAAYETAPVIYGDCASRSANLERAKGAGEDNRPRLLLIDF